MMQTDLIIIGAGPGGYRAAELAAKGGLQVVIVERSHLGGTCLNEGCIPTKCYARNAEALMLVNEASTFGINISSIPTFCLSQARERKEEVVKQLREGIGTLLSHPAITIMEGDARFIDSHTVTIEADKPEIVTAPNIIIATGSVPKRLPIKLSDDCQVLDSSDLLQLDSLPRRLCIIGAGVIGMEFASIFNAFGTEVTVVEYLRECLPQLDSDIAKRLRKALERRGVKFCMQSSVTAIERHGDEKLINFTDKKGRQLIIQADEVLMAVGRAPRITGDLQEVGIDCDKRAGIHVDGNLQTNVPGVYAIGDVNGLQMLAHAAEAQACQVVAHILSNAEAKGKRDIPAAIFTFPEAACVGKSEDRLKEEGKPYECRKAFHRANGKALAMAEAEGMLKLLSEPHAGRIVGCHAYGAHAADMVQEVSVLMEMQVTVRQLREMIHIHPTISEIIVSAAEQTNSAQ